MRFRKHLLFSTSLVSIAATLLAAPCNTPPAVSAQSVTIEAGTFQIVDVLALTVSLSGDTCPPQISTVVDPHQALRILAGGPSPSCRVSFRVSDGAGGLATSHVTVTVTDPPLIFSDGFETGSTAAWSGAHS
jgi:hypothetical protein